MQEASSVPDYSGNATRERPLCWSLGINGPSKSTCYDKQLSYLTLLDIASRGILDVVGDDVGGRKIILISACRFPSDRVSYITKLES